MKFETTIKDILKDSKKIAILGIGSSIMSDDAVGIRIAERLNDKFKKSYKKNAKCKSVKIFIGGTAPENLTGEIRNFQPDHLVLIDAADMKEEPGSFMIIDSGVISGVSFSTHMLPLKVLIAYLEKETNCNTTILGIQPQSVTFGEKLSPCVEKATEEMSEIIANVVSGK